MIEHTPRLNILTYAVLILSAISSNMKVGLPILQKNFLLTKEQYYGIYFRTRRSGYPH